MEEPRFEHRYFMTYRGVKTLPSKMVSPIGEDALSNRNTYVRAAYNSAGRLCGFEKYVYGEVELFHRYAYDDAGRLVRAEIGMADEDTVIMHFDSPEEIHS